MSDGSGGDLNEHSAGRKAERILNIEDYPVARQRFIYGEPTGFFDAFSPLRAEPSSLDPLLEAFEQNLASALTVGCIPFQLTQSTVLDMRYNQLLIAARIRAREPDEMPEAERDALADAEAHKAMEDELKLKDNIQRHAASTLARLERHLRDPRFLSSSEDLLRQVLVMSWGAFENFVNDLARYLLNLRPSLVGAVSQSRPYKDVITTKTLLSGLEGAGFNLADRMGDFIADLVSLDSVEKIQAAAEVLFQSAELDAALKDKRLWRIAQQRHVIVHRRGVVDARYKERTGDQTPLGQKLTFKAKEVEGNIAFLRDLGCSMYRAALQRLE